MLLFLGNKQLLFKDICYIHYRRAVVGPVPFTKPSHVVGPRKGLLRSQHPKKLFLEFLDPDLESPTYAAKLKRRFRLCLLLFSVHTFYPVEYSEC